MSVRAIGDLMLEQFFDLVDTLEKFKKKLRKAIVEISDFYPSYVERVEAIIRELDELIEAIDKTIDESGWKDEEE